MCARCFRVLSLVCAKLRVAPRVWRPRRGPAHGVPAVRTCRPDTEHRHPVNHSGPSTPCVFTEFNHSVSLIRTRHSAKSAPTRFAARVSRARTALSRFRRLARWRVRVFLPPRLPLCSAFSSPRAPSSWPAPALRKDPPPDPPSPPPDHPSHSAHADADALLLYTRLPTPAAQAIILAAVVLGHALTELSDAALVRGGPVVDHMCLNARRGIYLSTCMLQV